MLPRPCEGLRTRKCITCGTCVEYAGTDLVTGESFMSKSLQKDVQCFFSFENSNFVTDKSAEARRAAHVQVLPFTRGRGMACWKRHPTSLGSQWTKTLKPVICVEGLVIENSCSPSPCKKSKTMPLLRSVLYTWIIFYFSTSFCFRSGALNFLRMCV